MPNSIPEWHEYLLSRLLAYRATHPAFTFSPRRTDDARFKAGYWFQGTENYLFCAPFKFNEPNNKTKTIGLVLLFNKGELTGINYDIVFGAPSCQEHLPLYREILKLFGVEYEDTRWRYVIPAPQDALDAVIDDFCSRLVPAIAALIREFGLEQEYLVRETELDRALEKISARKKQGLVALQKDAQVEDTDEDVGPGGAAWLVGAYWDGDDMSARFVDEGRWENGYDDRFLSQVKAVREGDRIAIKTTYTQTKGLPFDNRDKSVSCMQIKARGTVIGNPGDGKNLTVQWERGFQPITIYHYTYRPTISRIDALKYPEVIDWIFEGVPQPLAAAPVVSSAAPVDDTGLAEFYGPSPRNVIFHGPPGTGKTRTLVEDVLPAYMGETDREPEEVQMTRTAASLGWFEVIAAVMIEEGRPLRVPQIRNHAFVMAKLRSGSAPAHLNQLIWTMAQNHSVRDSVTVNSSLERRIEPLVFDKDAESRWALVPDWKQIAPELTEAHRALKPGSTCRTATVERFEFVTFHPSFSYEDLVEGLRPMQVEDEDGTRTIDILPRDGALKRICKRAKDDPNHRYALIIDEINRGNIAKIFGELITLVEPDKRVRYDPSGRRIAGIEVTLPCTGEKFGVPANVDLYGTMNTADRSIALVDLALRRRFLFRAMPPDPDVIAGGDGNGLIDPDDDDAPINLRRLLRVLNARLTVLRGPDTRIGHAYLTAIEDIGALRAAFRDRIIPLLQEYFFDDLEGVARVLTVKKGAAPFVRPIVPQVSALFGAAAEPDDFDEQPVWRVEEDMPAESFRALYDGVPDSALQIG